MSLNEWGLVMSHTARALAYFCSICLGLESFQALGDVSLGPTYPQTVFITNGVTELDVLIGAQTEIEIVDIEAITWDDWVRWRDDQFEPLLHSISDDAADIAYGSGDSASGYLIQAEDDLLYMLAHYPLDSSGSNLVNSALSNVQSAMSDVARCMQLAEGIVIGVDDILTTMYQTSPGSGGFYDYSSVYPVLVSGTLTLSPANGVVGAGCNCAEYLSALCQLSTNIYYQVRDNNGVLTNVLAAVQYNGSLISGLQSAMVLWLSRIRDLVESISRDVSDIADFQEGIYTYIEIMFEGLDQQHILDMDWRTLNAVQQFLYTGLDMIDTRHGMGNFAQRFAAFYMQNHDIVGVTNVLDSLNEPLPLTVKLDDESQFPEAMAVTNFYKNGRLVPLYVTETNDMTELEHMEHRADSLQVSDLEPSTTMFQSFPSGVDFSELSRKTTLDSALKTDELPAMVQVVDSYTFRYSYPSSTPSGNSGEFTVTSGYWSFSSSDSQFLRGVHDLFHALWLLFGAALSAPFLWWAFELGLRLTSFVYAVLNNKDTQAAFGSLIKLRGFMAD